MKNYLRWNNDQKKRAHARIFEDLMRRRRLGEKQIVDILGDEGPKAQSTISRWKTLQVKPNRPAYIDLLKNVFQLEYHQIDAMLWLSGIPTLLREEVATIFRTSAVFRDRTETELAAEAYKLLIYVIGNDLGLSAPEENLQTESIADDSDFRLTIDTSGKDQSLNFDELPVVIEGQYWPPYSEPHVWVVLQDSQANYYLQSPPIHFLPDGRWVADNIIPGEGIIAIHLVKVGARGNSEFMHKVERREWGAFSNLPSDAKIIKSIQISLKTNPQSV